MAVHTEYNFLPGQYRAFVRTTYRDGFKTLQTVESNKYIFTNNAFTLISVVQGVPIDWDGSELEILSSGQNNVLTVSATKSGNSGTYTYVFTYKFKISNTTIYTFTDTWVKQTYSSGESGDVSFYSILASVFIQFLKDDTNQVMKPSFISASQDIITDGHRHSLIQPDRNSVFMMKPSYSGTEYWKTAHDILTLVKKKKGSLNDSFILSSWGYSSYGYLIIPILLDEITTLNLCNLTSTPGGASYQMNEVSILKSDYRSSTGDYAMYTINNDGTDLSLLSAGMTATSVTYSGEDYWSWTNNDDSTPMIFYTERSLSNIKLNGSNYSCGTLYSYNQQSPTDAEMEDLYTWLSAGVST